MKLRDGMKQPGKTAHVRVGTSASREWKGKKTYSDRSIPSVRGDNQAMEVVRRTIEMLET